MKGLDKLSVEKIAKTFAPGKLYYVYEFSEKNISTGYSARNFNTKNFHVFQYVEKKGIHHVFKNKLGGWIYTQTDQQLIGKYIKEAEA